MTFTRMLSFAPTHASSHKYLDPPPFKSHKITSFFLVTPHYPPTLSLQESYTLESERNMVARHYDQTYDQVNHQIDSARQLVEIRKQSQDSPDRPYPRRPKNRVNNDFLLNM